MNATRHILEIGPGFQPLHYRSPGLTGTDRFQLIIRPHETYTALDIEGSKLEEGVEGNIWREAKIKYNGRIQIVEGDREDIPFRETTFDEVVSLGSFAVTQKQITEVDRVLKSEGLLRLGMCRDARIQIQRDLGGQLRDLGYSLRPVSEHKYQRPYDDTVSTMYRLRTFQKH